MTSFRQIWEGALFSNQNLTSLNLNFSNHQTLVRLRYRQDHRKCGSVAGSRACENMTAMILNKFFAPSQADTCSMVLGFWMKALKNIQDLNGVVLAESDPIIYEIQTTVLL